MSSSFKVLFLLKKGRCKSAESSPIYVRLTVAGKRVEWSIQRNIKAGMKWDQHRCRVVGNKAEMRELNSYLDAVEGNIFSIQREYALRDQLISAEEVRSRILKKVEVKTSTLIEIYSHHNNEFKQLVGLEYSNGTFKKFKSALKSLTAFLKWKFNKEDVTLAEVDHKFISDYEFYLKSVQKLQHNSAMGNMKKLKKVVRICVANEWMIKDPFKSYKITTRETHRDYLLKEELEILISKKIQIPRLDQVRDIFLFSCYTGLSYADVMKLKATDIAIGIDGEQWIFTSRTKTETVSRIPLLPVAKEIVQKYASILQGDSLSPVLPRLSNQRLNSYLKELCDICGFQKQLTFHCARHTFATTVTLTNGVPIETVAKMLGHKSLRTTQQYAKILDTKVSHDMKELKRKLKGAI